jgi:hypothetical protein
MEARPKTLSQQNRTPKTAPWGASRAFDFFGPKAANLKADRPGIKNLTKKNRRVAAAILSRRGLIASNPHLLFYSLL